MPLSHNYKSTKHTLNIRRTHVFECPSDSPELNHKEEVCNIMNMRCERLPNDRKFLCVSFSPLWYHVPGKQIILEMRVCKTLCPQLYACP